MVWFRYGFYAPVGSYKSNRFSKYWTWILESGAGMGWRFLFSEGEDNGVGDQS